MTNCDKMATGNICFKKFYGWSEQNITLFQSLENIEKCKLWQSILENLICKLGEEWMSRLVFIGEE